ncbi:ArsR/SmtB family transcription factor [Amycolatopsis sp. CA-230715]|uniref:ArsR/SmtB family transcription factor n=1 Tax=Amycolatopsis sp. CA-230715 TaxID=2745196 RepID=UPI001C02AC9F|nr:winged helix-turn-helix domain-containing protein [Amycolatopsis sp. CA-230715]QWF85841.1 hypothetical protein HUW46_09321 [Amycolatopsis sp. CA-230715]
MADPATPYPVDRDLLLKGRGLLLIPSFFCRSVPVTFIDPRLQPVLAYPVTHHSEHEPAPEAMVARLSGALGRTRATILVALRTPASTTELAHRAALSPASISEQTTILRQAGLTTRRRHGQAVRHSITQLGRDLLAATPD